MTLEGAIASDELQTPERELDALLLAVTKQLGAQRKAFSSKPAAQPGSRTASWRPAPASRSRRSPATSAAASRHRLSAFGR